jgi:hypothetical protein
VILSDKRTGYVIGSGSTAVLAGLTALAFAPAEPVALGWGVLGWAVATIAGTWAGARLVVAHGRDGRAFLIAYFAWMAVRFAAYALGLTAALVAGFPAVVAYLAGVAVAHVTTQGFEWAWFARKAA